MGKTQIRFKVLVTLLAVTGCAQPSKITANNCEVVHFESISGVPANTSGINYPPGKFRDFAELALTEDHELIRQRNWDEATADQQYCALNVMTSKAPSQVVTRLNEAAQGKHPICGTEYAGLVQAVRGSWQEQELKAAIAANCGA